ncbi:MAG TPA: hypothetical protein VK186_28225 [Candidatus Deferrimicrobium sp.]|nr:hypothetical protein [Candidatus Deferrimicrobium sp.]
MNLTDCPYTDCRQQDIPAYIEICPGCNRWLKRCNICSTANRVFSNFCRYCGGIIPDSNESWSGCKGGGQRSGLNRYVIQNSPPDIKLNELKNFSLSKRCRAALAADGFFITISDDGMIKIINLNNLGEEPFSFNINNKIFAEPAVHKGTLYVGCIQDEDQDKGAIHAYTLGGISLDPPEVQLRWTVSLKGTPVQALLPFENRLYLNIGHKNGGREIHVIENIMGNKPTDTISVYNGERSSTVVGDIPTKRVFFLSKNDKQLLINTFDHTKNSPEMISKEVHDSPSDILDHIPISVLGSKVFAVFGEKRDLCRLDSFENIFESRITGKVRQFALAGMNKHIIINSTGVFSSIGNAQENLNQGESIISGPIVLRDKAVLVGLNDGRIRFYNLNNISVQNDFQVFNGNEKVQVLASFRDIIAIGNQNGGIKLLQLL